MGVFLEVSDFQTLYYLKQVESDETFLMENIITPSVS